ncbi:DUF6470 family protein [Niallia sp. FSL R7-0271]|uniref:DUF6470 family protein n=1 Tax=Niallia sp. FSL R7-0271 TaxID=2921678 RepID=UPI0030FC101C
MQIPQLRIDSTPAKLGLTTVQPQVQMEQKPADLYIEQPKAELIIDKKAATLTIDQTEARAYEGMKTRERFIDDYVQKGRQEWLKGIARRIKDGQQLAAIENKGNPIPQIAKRNSEGPPKQFGLGWIPPANSVKIQYDPGYVKTSFETYEPIIDVNQNKPLIDYTPGKVITELVQYPSLEIHFENLKSNGVNYQQSK